MSEKMERDRKLWIKGGAAKGAPAAPSQPALLQGGDNEVSSEGLSLKTLVSALPTFSSSLTLSVSRT